MTVAVRCIVDKGSFMLFVFMYLQTTEGTNCFIFNYPFTEKTALLFQTSPKVEETHFKIIHEVYPAAKFLKNGLILKWTLVPCIETDETLEPCFIFSRPVSNKFWLYSILQIVT